MAEILAYCNESPKLKTRIMYQNNLSYDQLRSYLVLLTSNGLLTRDLGAFTTTEKGHHFLKVYAELKGVIPNRALEAIQGV